MKNTLKLFAISCILISCKTDPPKKKTFSIKGNWSTSSINIKEVEVDDSDVVTIDLSDEVENTISVDSLNNPIISSIREDFKSEKQKQMEQREQAYLDSITKKNMATQDSLLEETTDPQDIIDPSEINGEIDDDVNELEIKTALGISKQLKGEDSDYYKTHPEIFKELKFNFISDSIVKITKPEVLGKTTEDVSYKIYRKGSKNSKVIMMNFNEVEFRMMINNMNQITLFQNSFYDPIQFQMTLKRNTKK